MNWLRFFILMKDPPMKSTDMNPRGQTPFKFATAFVTLVALFFAFVPRLSGGEGKNDYGNLVIIDVRDEPKNVDPITIKINGEPSVIKDGEVSELLEKIISSCELLVVNYNGSYYGQKIQNFVLGIQNKRDKLEQSKKTFYVDMSGVGGKSQKGVAIAFSDKSGSGISFNGGIVRHESEIGKAVEAASKSGLQSGIGVRRVLWIADGSLLATRFARELEKKKIEVLPAKTKPEFH